MTVTGIEELVQLHIDMERTDISRVMNLVELGVVKKECFFYVPSTAVENIEVRFDYLYHCFYTVATTHQGHEIPVSL